VDSSTLILLEGAIILVVVLGFGVWQLWSVRRDLRTPPAPPPSSGQPRGGAGPTAEG
jgi:hypothetical protein